MTTNWLLTAQAAERLGLTVNRTRKLIRKGIIPAVKTGSGGPTSRYRVTEQAVDDYARTRYLNGLPL